MGFKDRLKEAREKYASKKAGGAVSGAGKTSSTMKAGPGKGLRGRNAIGTYTTRSGRIKNIKPLSPSQEARYQQKAEKWKKIPRDKLEKQAQSFKAGGGGLAALGTLMVLPGLILLTLGYYYLEISLPLIITGLIFLGAGGGAVSAGGFRRKYLVLTLGKVPEKVTKSVLDEIALKFIKSS